jgi:serine/threonine protein kinase
MSPEAAAGEPAAPSFDLWALAVVLYESMAGSRPFRGQDAWETLERIQTSPAPDIRDAWPEAPAAVAALFQTLLALDPAQRPPDASAFGSALGRLRDSLG